MVSFYTPPKKKVVSLKAFEIQGKSLDLLGRGVCSQDGCTYFCDGLLPGESARVVTESLKGKVGTLKITKILKASSLRQNPDCDLLQKCGGCPLQHIDKSLALEGKIEGLRRLFKKSLGVSLDAPDLVIESEGTNYRRACRLSARADRGVFRLGFRAEKSHALVPVEKCNVLTTRINEVLPNLRACIDNLSCKHSVGHVELLDSDGALGILLRMTKFLSKDDELVLKNFADKYSAVMSVSEPFKPKISFDKDAIVLKERVIAGNEEDLFVTSQGIKVLCQTSSFVQVNSGVNDKLGAFVVDTLNPQKGKRILDLFCGLGNFTLPIAAKGADVCGVDIVRDMIAKANNNAKKANLENARFAACNLEEPFETQTFAQGNFDCAVLDPGRQGAPRATKFLASKKVKTIVMISCNPQACARDSIELINKGYKIKKWGVMDMFPRTRHIETVLVFFLS